MANSDLKNDVKEISAQLKQNPNDENLRINFFWAIHKWAKSEIEDKSISHSISAVLEMSKYQINSTMGYNSTGWNIYKILKILAQDPDLKKQNQNSIPLLVKILNKLEIDNNSHLYSSLFWALNKLAESNSVWFLSFIKVQGLQKFSTDDYQPRVYNGKKLNSLALSVHLKAAKIIENLPEGRLQSINWFFPYLNKILEKYPYEIWLNYHKSKFYIIQGESEKSRRLIFNIMKKKDREFWLWHLLGETFENSEDEKALSCFSKGLLIGGKPEMLLGLKLSTAKLLFKLGYFAEARTELETIIEIREKNKWKINDELIQLLNNKKIIESEKREEIEAFYKEKAITINKILIEQFPEYHGIVINIIEEKKWVFINFELNKTARYILKKGDDFKIGDIVSARISENIINGEKKYDAKYLEKIHSNSPLNFVKTVKGQVRINKGNVFGFVEDVFIPENLITQQNISDKDLIEGIALLEYNKKKNVNTWKIITISKIKN